MLDSKHQNFTEDGNFVGVFVSAGKLVRATGPPPVGRRTSRNQYVPMILLQGKYDVSNEIIKCANLTPAMIREAKSSERGRHGGGRHTDGHHLWSTGTSHACPLPLTMSPHDKQPDVSHVILESYEQIKKLIFN